MLETLLSILAAIITIVASIEIHGRIVFANKAQAYFTRKKLVRNTLGVGIIFTVITETGSILLEHWLTGNWNAAVISRGISFCSSISLAGYSACYLEWFHDHKRQIWDKIRNKVLHIYVESTACSLIVWGLASILKLTVMTCFFLIKPSEALITLCSSFGLILLGLGTFLMRLIIWVRRCVAK